MQGKIAASGQLGVYEHSCPAAEHCCTEASSEEFELEVEAAEPKFVIVAAGLDKGPHLPEVLEPQEPSVGLGAMGVEKTFGHPKHGKNRCSS